MDYIMSEDIIQNVKWYDPPKGLTALTFDVVLHGRTQTIKIKNKHALNQFREMKNGRRIRAAFVYGKSEVEIWKMPKNRCRIECRHEGVIHLNVMLNEKDMRKLFEFNIVSE